VRAVVRDSGLWREQGRKNEEGTRGRGLGIMRELMENVEVSRSDAGTTVTMSRQLSRSEVA
jgi:anti-sigma regulatory factor (Ser/Thr protein kinase)